VPPSQDEANDMVARVRWGAWIVGGGLLLLLPAGCFHDFSKPVGSDNGAEEPDGADDRASTDVGPSSDASVSTEIGPGDGSVADGETLSESTTVLVPQAGGVRVATDGATVFWTNSRMGGVYACSVAGCNATPTLIAAAQVDAWDIALGPEHVYWTAANNVMSCALSGCGGSPRYLGTHVPPPRGIAFDPRSGYLYWASGNIWRCLTPACDITTRGFIGAMLDLPGGSGGSLSVFAVDADNGRVHWVGYDGETIFSTPSDGFSSLPVFTPETMPVAAAPNEAWITLASRQSPGGIVTDGRYVYWTNTASGEVMKCLTDGSQSGATVIAAGQDQPTDMAIDDGALYWINRGGGTLMRCEPHDCGSTATAIARNQESPSGLAVDTTSVYWAHEGGIMRAPKGAR
jgi:hypothetical protein